MSTVCDHYTRPEGVMGGPCLNCGLSQPEHVEQPPALCTTSGEPVAAVREKQRDEASRSESGQYSSYIVLCPDERAKGFVRPYRDAYRHLACGTITTMGRALSETYARIPTFYDSTFCTKCQKHFPVGPDGEFVWYEMDGTIGPKVGT